MFQIEENSSTITFRVSSEMQMIEGILRKTNLFLLKHDVTESPVLTMVLRELLKNAIQHGNKNESHQIVTCCIQLQDKMQVKIMVEDNGDGFSHKNIDTRQYLDPKNHNPCGYLLIHAFSDRVEFNDKGNRVTIFITIPKESVRSLLR